MTARKSQSMCAGKFVYYTGMAKTKAAQAQAKEQRVSMSTIKLDAQESRQMWFLAHAKDDGKPIHLMMGGRLVALGFAERVSIEKPDTSAQEAALWQELLTAVTEKSLERVSDITAKLEEFNDDNSDGENYGYVLTDLGRELVKHGTVKIGSE